MIIATISNVSADTTDSMSDLLLRISDRDPAAWNEILRRYGTLVSMTVRSFRLQEADVLDAIQMTWLRLAEHAHRVQFPERLGGWLATTARRECLHILHQTKRALSVEQVAVDKAYGALPVRLHQFGLVVGHNADLLYVRFDHEYHLTSLRPHLVRLVQAPGRF